MFQPRFHFKSLALDNSAESEKDESVSTVVNDRGDDTPSPVILTGTQMVKKFNGQSADRAESAGRVESADRVVVFMALYRVVHKSIDLVLTMNVPVEASGGDAVGEQAVPAARADFDTAATSLRILDYSLFA